MVSLLLTMCLSFNPMLATRRINKVKLTELHMSDSFWKKTLAAGMISVITSFSSCVFADSFPEVPLYSKKGSDLQTYSDIGRGFRLLR